MQWNPSCMMQVALLKTYACIIQVLQALSQFGKSDDLYALMNKYEIKPWETWTIEQKVIHAPGE